MSGGVPGKGLNAICPYFTMFPLAFPYEILDRFASPGDWVLDPFCGRGTTNYAARLLGLPSLGIDSNRVATAIAQAKLATSSPEAIIQEASHILRERSTARDVPKGEFWDLAFHQDVLPTVCRLREALLDDCSADARVALRAIVMGALHGPFHQSGTSYLSNQAPRTYAPKPRYSVKFWRARGLVPPQVDVLDLIRVRAERYYSGCIELGEGKILLADSRLNETWAGGEPVIAWVITSPPYYGVNTYNPDQWLRRWFLGGPPTVDYSTVGQMRHSSPDVFAGDLRQVWSNAASVCRANAQLVVRFGGIHDRKADPLSVIKASFDHSGWTVLGIASAGSAASGRRQSLHFLPGQQTARDEYDVWARLTP